MSRSIFSNSFSTNLLNNRSLLEPLNIPAERYSQQTRKPRN